MPYSLDFIKKVINFVENGGTITKAAHTFGIRRASIYRWLLTGWLVSLMVDTVIIWDNKLNNNSIKKGMGFWIWEVAIANSLLSILWVDYLFIEKVLKIVKNMIKKGY